MNFIRITAVFVFSLIAFVVFTGNQSETTNFDMKLNLKLDPETGTISGVIEYQNPSDSSFFLTDGLTVESVITNGKASEWKKSKPNNSTFSSKYTLSFVPENLVIEFSGVIKTENYPKTISNLNLINKDMFELTDLIDWYPRIKYCKSINYLLEVEVPSDFGLVTNGKILNETFSKGKRRTTAESLKPGNGISLFGSKGLKKSVAETNGYQLEIYYSKLPEEYIGKMIKNLAGTVELYQNLYGSNSSNKLVRIIYSTRPAGGYARGSVIVVSEEFAFAQINHQWGFARDFQLNAHEIAHLWSKAGSADDWINEGLAEYSAFLASEKYIGNEFAKLLLGEYTTAIENSATQLSIPETTGDSWESHINRYYKPTVLLNSLRQQYGEEKMAEFIKALDFAFIQNHGGTTEIFLEELKKSPGKEAHDFFSEGLHRKNWNNQAEVSEVVYDADFQGTWIGSLTQFGTTSKFVLHLKKVDNKLVPSLDSPDQNVYDIPVSGLKISGDSLSCIVGLASATYHGQLDRQAKSITGTWTQRGTDYPVNLTKEE